MFERSMLLPFMMKMNTTPKTDRKMDSFCRSDVASLRNREAIISVTTGVKEYKIPPSAEVACCSPNTWRVKKPSGYMAARSSTLCSGLPR
ncbi:hypothetical protein D3C73_1493180 [compost metagenome]